MKIRVISLLLIAGCLSASGQFFSAEEKAEKEAETKAELVSSLPEDMQKEIYIQYCAAEMTAEQKARGLHPEKIHHTPEQRETIHVKMEHTRNNLLDLYKADLAKAHNLDPAYLEKIIATGKEKEWPQTPPPAEDEQ